MTLKLSMSFLYNAKDMSGLCVIMRNNVIKFLKYFFQIFLPNNMVNVTSKNLSKLKCKLAAFLSLFTFSSAADSLIVTILSMIGKAGASAAINGIYIFTSEIYTTEVRNVGLGTGSTVAFIGSMIAPYVGGLFVSIQ